MRVFFIFLSYIVFAGCHTDKRRRICNSDSKSLTPYFSVFNPNAGKYGPEKTPYLDSISPYSVRMRENTDKKKLLIWTLSTQCHVMLTKCLKQQNLFSLLWPDHNIRRAKLPPQCKFRNSHSVAFLEKNGMSKSLPNLKVHINYRQWCCKYNETFQIKHQIINFRKIHGIQETQDKFKCMYSFSSLKTCLSYAYFLTILSLYVLINVMLVKSVFGLIRGRIISP